MNFFFRNLLKIGFIQLSAILIMGIIRLLTFLLVPTDTSVAIPFASICKVFLNGLRFDNVIGCYIMILPVTVLIIQTIFGLNNKWIWKSLRIYIFILFSLSFTINIVNIPYFSYFFENINASIYQWFIYPLTTFGMLFSESAYWGYGLLIILIIGLWWKLLKSRFLIPYICKVAGWRQKAFVSILGILLIGAYVFGIRGRMGYNPIKISQAYFCDDPFLNQLGINPTFNMIVTTNDIFRKENNKLNLMNGDEAFAKARKLLGLPDDNAALQEHSLSRNIKSGLSDHKRKNVIIILMESMAEELLHKGDTPFLDSLCTVSTFYRNAYSAGNHTNHGVYSTLYSFPSVMFRNMLKGSRVSHVNGLPQEFREKGYTTIFFMTHESQYDNMNAFLRTNGFDIIRSQENYPRKEIVNSFGVPDRFLFQYSLNELSDFAEKDTPFFAVLLTISNHPPYIIPDQFKSKSIPPERQIVRYADASLKYFFEKAKTYPWYKDTIFILLGDHGKILDKKESQLPESFNHIPLIIHGDGIPAEEKSQFALQIDVAPTILGIMGWDYQQDNFGLDLNEYERDIAFYTGDNYLVARDTSNLYLFRPSDGAEYCYSIADGEVKATGFNCHFQILKDYLFAMIQSAEEYKH